MKKIGLVLTGGGARAAYQVGVLKAIAEMGNFKETPFQIVSGVSAGAINGVAIASGAHDFIETTKILWELWAGLRSKQIYKTDTLTLFSIGTRLMKDLSLGGVLKKSKSNYLLDTSPLYSLIRTAINFERLNRHIESGALHGVAVTATNYFSGTCVTFYDGSPNIKPWFRGTRISKPTKIDSAHVMASSAIPVFFPPIKVEGSFYGDGGIRFTAPLSPVIHMGCDAALAIGIRHSRSHEMTVKLNEAEVSNPITMADIAGVLLNALFLDSLDTDLERMERINRTMSLLKTSDSELSSDQLRQIPVLAIKPSKDLGTLASDHFKDFPASLRHLLRGIGASEEKGWDLLSYLAFDAPYTSQLLKLGYEDAFNQANLLRDFLTIS